MASPARRNLHHRRSTKNVQCRVPKDFLTRHLSVFDREVYRCYYSVSPSENLFADLDFDDHDASLNFIQALADQNSGISHSEKKLDRPMAYGNLLHEKKWHSLGEDLLKPLTSANKSRFSDGSFGVWYGALEQETAYTESLYWAYQFSKEDFAESRVKKRTIDRKMIKVKVSTSSAVDLQPLRNSFDLDSNSYDDCQQLGQFAKSAHIEVMLSPSVRHKGGVCTPVFSELALSAYQDVGWYRFEINANVSVMMTHRKLRTKIQLAS